jgi:alpha-tubulin suppressor-like RCC1 family protein
MIDDNNEKNVIDDAKGDVAPTENRTFDYALHVTNFHDPYSTIQSQPTEDHKMYAPLLSQDDSKVRLVAAGMNFTLAVTNSNLPYIWGKNVCLNPFYSESGMKSIRSKPVQDSTYPRYIPGLPPDLRIERVACGSHHAAMLLEDGSIWAVGVATDNTSPMWNEAVEILAAGIINMNALTSFTSGFDRTVAVSDGQVIEVQLWSNEELRQNGAVRPSWVDWLENENGNERVRSVHRGWLHSVVVTESICGKL